jgi:uncharacterized protein YndB with AHSA1/START domain
MRQKPKTTVVVEPGALTIVITREFHAPRRLVFEAYTRPEHLMRWWGPRALTMITCEVDLRVGGAYRFVLRDPAGVEYDWHGVYREISPVDRLVQTEVFEGFPDAEAIDTVVFTERDGRTLVTTTVLHATVEARDGHVAAGMETGVVETYERLDELLSTELT